MERIYEISEKPLVGIIMGSKSDLETMQETMAILDELQISYEANVVSAHRTPDKMFEYAELARERGIKVIVAGAGGAAHLPGMVAAKTTLPVIGVPVQSRALNGMDSLLSIVQMPGGIPVATVAIGKAGAKNAGLLAASMLSTSYDTIATKLDEYRQMMTDAVLKDSDLNDQSYLTSFNNRNHWWRSTWTHDGHISKANGIQSSSIRTCCFGTTCTSSRPRN